MERNLDIRKDADLEHDQRRAPADADRDAAPANLGGAVVQHKADAGRVVLSDGADVQAAATQGVAGGGAQLPHFDRIQQSFGAAHDLSGVRAHVGGDAATASEQMGAQGFATGNDVAFQKQPDVHLAAHEAAHVVQQRQGVSMKGGVGEAGDAYEQHADKVADRVVAGQSAADLLPGNAAGGGDAAIQMFNETAIKGEQWRVSETGKSMLKQDGTLQELYASDDLVATANAALKTAGDKGSFISLKKGSGALTIGSNTLHKIDPHMDPTGTEAGANKLLEDANAPGGKDSEGDKGDTMGLWADCGRSSRTVMGTDGAGKAPHANYKDGGKTATTARSYKPSTYSDEIYMATIPDFLKVSAAAKYLKDGVHYTGDKTHLKTPTDADDARKMYWEFGEEGRRAFDAFAGINTAANPEIGGAYTMNTEYNMPGSAEVPGKSRWNFHWGGVVLKDGSNNVTLENYAVGFAPTGDAKKDAENSQKAYNWINRGWNFQMYGTSKKGQSFQEEHLSTGTHGTQASTFAAKVD